MKKLLQLKSPPKRICILRLSALGDVVHTVAVVRAVQKNWPDCEITWICGSFEHKLLKLIDGIDFVVFNKKNGFSAYLKLRNDLKGKTFDILLHMQVAFRANIASLFVRAPVRLGWDRQRSRDLHQLFINHSVESSSMQHQQDGFLSFVTALGVPVTEAGWRLPITNNAKAFADAHISAVHPVLLISACSSHVLRNWSAEKYAAVADYAIEKWGFQVVLSGGPSAVEQDMANAICHHSKHQLINLVGKDTLEQLLGLLNRADIVISPDSGPAHIANALGIPVIGLYACTWSRRSGPYNSLTYTVDYFEQATEKFLNQTAQSLPWGSKVERAGVMDLISTDTVIESLNRVVVERKLAD